MKIYNIPRRTHSELASGKNNAAWLGGISSEPYGDEWNHELREKIRKRDNYTCQECGLRQKELKTFHKKLPVHHIDYDKTNNDPMNLITLCIGCHSKTRWEKKDWTNHFRQKLLNRQPQIDN
jgi:5-methylcytosine-specific restriction endonuclease McrA